MWERLRQAVDALSLRERVIVMVAALLVVYGVWYVLWFYHASAKREAILADIENYERERSELNAQLQTFRQITGGEALKGKRAEISRAQERLSELDAELAQLTHGLVGADQLAQVLQDVLGETQSLTLLELQTEPVTMVRIDKSSDGDAASSGVYRHSVSLTVGGRYFEVLDFLKRLEALDWRFYWESLDYQVEGYPQGRATIKVFTLSAEKGRLGV